MKHKFEIGEKVRIHATKTSSDGVKLHDGEIVTISTYDAHIDAYTLEEYGADHLWKSDCFKTLNQ